MSERYRCCGHCAEDHGGHDDACWAYGPTPQDLFERLDSAHTGIEDDELAALVLDAAVFVRQIAQGSVVVTKDEKEAIAWWITETLPGIPRELWPDEAVGKFAALPDWAKEVSS